MLLQKLFQLLHKPNYEPEHTEPVEHDTVLTILEDGTVVDWTEGENDT